MRKLTIFSFALAFCMLTSLQAQVNEFDSEVKLNSVKKNTEASSILIQNEDGTIGIRPIESFNIPSLRLNGEQLEVELNGERFTIDLSENFVVDPDDLIQSFELNGTLLELGVLGNDSRFVVDLEPIIREQYKSALIGEWSTVSNVTSNAPGDIANDDLVFGSSQLGNGAGTDDDSRMFFDKSKSAFRAGTVAGNEWNDANVGDGSVAFGDGNTADGNYSAAMGTGNNVTGNSSLASGQDNTVSAKNAGVFGQDNMVSGNKSFAYGAQVEATAQNAIAGGLLSKATANYGIALGNNTEASGEASVALGSKTEATMEGATAVGKQTNATGLQAFAAGYQTTASNESATALGILSNAQGKASLAAGEKTRAESYAQTTIGSFSTNKVGDANNHVATDRLFVIGNGTSNAAKSDALTVLKNGNTTLNGTLTLDGDNVGGSDGYTLPAQDGNANEYMMTDGSGNASWSALPANNDNDASNELQTISTNSNPGNITLSNGGGTLNLNVSDADSDTSNEIQTISASGGATPTINLSNSGGTITLAAGTNVTLSQSGNTITINSTGGGGGGGGMTTYGDGSAGNLVIAGAVDWSASAPANNNYQFNDLTINAGATLTILSGSVIRCNGTFTNNGTINVLPGVPEARWAGHPDDGYPRTQGFTENVKHAFNYQALVATFHFGQKGGSNGADGGHTGLENFGGSGGGTLVIRAKTAFNNAGTINAAGGNGYLGSANTDTSGPGGGGGGFILIISDGNASNTGTINVKGGNGSAPGTADDDHAGGGGGGGMIHIVSPNANAVAGTFNVAGGTAGVEPGGNLGTGGGEGGAGAGNGGEGGSDSGGVITLAQNGFVGVVLKTQVAVPSNFIP